MPPLDLGVLVSGRGSNLQAILDAVAEGRLDARVRVVISNQADVEALSRAERAGVPTRVVSHRAFADRAGFDAALVSALREAGASWVVLAGFMRLLTPTFLEAFPDRVVNIHPALSPSFPGVDAQQQALDHGVKLTGCTVHLVDAGTDTGPILAQAVVPVLDGDDRAQLGARLLEMEHALLVQALGWIAEGRLELVPSAAPGGRTRARFAGVVPVLGLRTAGGAAEGFGGGPERAP
ncbi:phosphoribosylglycinamide formyltransferase [Chondromyces crocatus]|uniref:Phosphoribosylglycinamide formyltransferase n=1 Tax=Chondromyces crocatus TaxID=52 RepID=A0A0K1E5L1_CHOCO|nr:phosphoribosylglycinamide formyltransferase [Chondromyces crocatus]AKT36124.1 phosphoribosylglycinamide formyltransferase [Chondromyces crocatus]